jgi:hypothetical protein
MSMLGFAWGGWGFAVPAISDRIGRKHWGVAPNGAQPNVASVDTATFCSRLKESAASLYVASATDYKHCYSDVPILGAFDFPYPTRDWRSKIGIADGPVGAAYAQGAAAIGVRVMAYWSGDQNVIVCRQAPGLRCGFFSKGRVFGILEVQRSAREVADERCRIYERRAVPTPVPRYSTGLPRRC